MIRNYLITKLPNYDYRDPQSGVALIITIILSGIMLISVGVFSKEMLDEAKNSTKIDHSLIAYYAAEAGLEEALLEWRYDHGAEISWQNDQNESVDVTKTENSTFRCVDLDTNTRIPPQDCRKEFATRYYDVRMWYKAPEIVDLEILRDNVVEIDVPDLTGDITFVWNNKNIARGSGHSVEVTVYNEDGTIVPLDQGGKFFTSPFPPYIVTIDASRIGTGKKTIRIKPWYTKLSQNPDGSYGEGAAPSGGLTPSIVLGATPEVGSTDLIGTPITTIESIGYYGGVARKIVGTLDRSSGNLIGIFDFVIYSGSDLVK